MRKKPEEHLRKGKTLAAQERSAEAIAEFRECICLKPEAAEAQFRLKPRSAEAHVYLAADLYRMGRIEEAAAEYRGVLRSDPLAEIDLNDEGMMWPDGLEW